MNVKQFSEKLGYIDSDLIEEAENACAAEKRGRPVKRICIAALAAALLLIASFSTVLALSAGFRAAVIDFFRLRTAETVIQGGDGANTGDIAIVSSTEVDGLVNIDYLKIDGDYACDGGVIFSYHEADGYAGGVYYRIADDGLVPLDTKRVETSFSCRGFTWSVRFDYAVIDGELYVHNMPDDHMPEIEETDAIFCYAAAMKDGDTQRVLLRLPFPHSNLRSYSEYAVEMDIGTGEITDFLSECGLDQLTDLVHEIAFSDDLNRAVITCFDSNFNGYVSYYYCDITDHKLVSITEITNEEVDACWLLNNETLFYTTGSSDGWRINLLTGAKEPVYTGLRPYTDADGGVQFLGGKYAILIGADRKAWLLDLEAGTQSLITGLTFTTLTGAYLNANHTKIYFQCYNADDLEIGNLGLLDISQARMLMMDRKGQEIRREWNVDWFDNDRIAVSAEDDNGSHYLYLYEFKN